LSPETACASATGDRLLLQIVYQQLPAELIQVSPRGGDIYKKCLTEPRLYNECLVLKLPLLETRND
ncbi:hypothetical protein, partial [Cronobacter sakazakii]|uniref:hypothetical protein n=1 Tax=Cronobacter sakazakii TaxID=28141 RepID=UPI00294B6C0B